MLKKNEVLEALDNGAMIMVDSIYRTARVLDADYNEIDTCRYDTAERIEKMDGYRRRKTDWYATWFIEIDPPAEEAREDMTIEEIEENIARIVRGVIGKEKATKMMQSNERTDDHLEVYLCHGGCCLGDAQTIQEEILAAGYFIPAQMGNAVIYVTARNPETQEETAQEEAQETTQEAQEEQDWNAESERVRAAVAADLPGLVTEEEQTAQTFPIITEAAQRAFEDHADGSPDETPAICGSYGRACRQMGQEEGANRALCQGCPLAAFCAENATQEEEAAPDYLDERCPRSNEQPGIWYSIEYHYPDGEGPYFFQARTVEDLEDKMAQLLRAGRSVVCGWRHDRTTGERRRFIAETRQQKTDRENRDHCRYIAETLDRYASGDLYKCPHCDEVHTMGDYEENEHENEDGCTCYTCPNCGEEIEEYCLEAVSMYDYFSDCYDIEYRCGSDREYRSVCIMVACGGPNIYIDTATKQVELYWWTDRASYPISYNTVEAVDAWAEEYWSCL